MNNTPLSFRSHGYVLNTQRLFVVSIIHQQVAYTHKNTRKLKHELIVPIYFGIYMYN